MLLFLVMLFLIGVLISLSSSSFFGVWVGLEISTLVSYPWIASTGEKSEVLSSSLFKLLVLQALSSIVLYVGAVVLWSFWGMCVFSIVLTVTSLYVKFGSIVMGWLVAALESLTWWGVFVLLGAQNVPAIVVLICIVRTFDSSHMMYSGFFLSLIGVAGVVVRSIRGFVLASSILNTSWIWCSSSSDMCLGLCFFLFYLLSFIAACLVICGINGQEYAGIFNSGVSLVESSVFWALSGLPPFALFFCNVDTVWALVFSGHVLVAAGLCLMSAIIMYIYIHLILASSMLGGLVGVYKSGTSTFIMLASALFMVVVSYVIFWLI